MPQNKRKTTEREKYVIQNNTCQEAMNILGLSRATIINICRDSDIMFQRLRAVPNTGRYGNRKKLKEDFKNGMTVAELAIKYDMVGSKVRDILQHKPHGLIFQHLKAEEADWLARNCPKDMTIYEYAAIIIREVYEGEKE